MQIPGESLGLCLPHRAAKRNKFGAVKVRGELRTFDSQGEARRDAELVLLEKARAISGLRRQVVFSLDVNGVHVCNYRADWTYFEAETRTLVVEDFKGVITDLYRIKRALMVAVHSIVIRESYAKRKRA